MANCAPTDIACQTVEYFVNVITPWILPAIVFIVSLVGIIAARSFKGKAFWAVIIILEVWYFVPFVAGVTLRQVLGLPCLSYFGGC